MCMEIYQRPRELMEDISALGLRHVGYGVPTELFMPFVEAGVRRSQVIQVTKVVNWCKMMWNKQPYDIWNPLCLGKAWSQSIYAMNLDCTGKLRPFQLNAVLIVLSTVSREGWMVLIWDLSIWISQFPTARKLQCVAFSLLGNSEKDASMIQWCIHVLDIGPATQHDRGMWMRRPLHLWDGLWPWFPSPWSERFWRRMPQLQFERHDV